MKKNKLNFSNYTKGHVFLLAQNGKTIGKMSTEELLPTDKILQKELGFFSSLYSAIRLNLQIRHNDSKKLAYSELLINMHSLLLMIHQTTEEDFLKSF
jgi:hypothetical protein